MTLCLFFPDCTDLALPGRHICATHLEGWCEHIGMPSPAQLDRCWMPPPEFAVTLAKMRGVGTQGLSAEQIALL